MKTDDAKDPLGRLIFFEVGNTVLRRAGVHAIVRHIPGVRAIHLRWREEEFIEFQVGSTLFVVLEPWNDSDRYWIVPKSDQVSDHVSEDLALVRRAFANVPRWWTLAVAASIISALLGFCLIVFLREDPGAVWYCGLILAPAGTLTRWILIRRLGRWMPRS